MFALLVACLVVAPPGCASSSTKPPAATPPRAAPAARSRPAPSQLPAPAPDAGGQSAVKIGSGTDPCAERLHALSAPLLLYYALHHRLPSRIEELRVVAGPDPAAAGFTCPVSGKPYVYDPRGLPRGAGKPGFIVLSDPEPTHAGMRLAVAVEEPTSPNRPLITHVVAEQEVLFHPAPSGEQGEVSE